METRRHPVEDRNNRRVDNVIRASQQSPLANASIEPNVQIFGNATDFFDGTYDPSPTMTQANTRRIFSGKIDEKEMQRRLCELLLNEGLVVPAAQIIHRRGLARIVRRKPYTSIKETSMSDLLEGYPIEYENDQTTSRPKKFRRIELGVPVTTTSRCDVSVKVQILNAFVAGDLEASTPKTIAHELHVGELKNSLRYKSAECTALSVLYMKTVLFWLRSRVGIAVDSVYGFAVCGSRCSDTQNHYRVSLLKLVAPQLLGYPLQVVEWSLVASNLDDTRPLTTLLDFLQRGKRAMADHEYQRHPNPSPCHCRLPSKMWTDSSTDYTLVRGGTTAIVYKANSAGVKALMALGGISDGLVNTVGRFLKHEPDKATFYVKYVANGDGFARFHMNCAIEEVQTTYPLLLERIVGASVAIMRDRGVPVSKDTFRTFAKLKAGFGNIWDLVKELCTSLIPCDTLPHNMVYDRVDATLHLIDIDEGQLGGIKKRVLEDGDEDALYSCYPNCLCLRFRDYALTQMAESVDMLVGDTMVFDNKSSDEATVRQLRQGLIRLRPVLKRENEREFGTDTALPPDMDAALKSVLRAMTTLFGDFYVDSSS